jgi:superfamily II DNA or RNA helicase
MSGARISWYAGTVALRGVADDVRAQLTEDVPQLAWDAREACLRTPAMHYASLVLALRARGIEGEGLVDEARRYPDVTAPSRVPALRPFQEEALAAWRKNKRRGVVVLPTGAGKSIVGVAAIAAAQRGALVVVPTLDLVRQWREVLASAWEIPVGDVGAIGGGEHDVKPLTVSTYDSAWTHMEHLGHRFGLVIFDEVHHLCAESYAFAARMCLAPYRLGLTATPERADGRDALLEELVGPIVYRKEIDELEGTFLAEYETHRVEVELSADERATYEDARATYRQFLSDNGIRISSPAGWGDFVKRSARTAEGRDAMRAYRLQKRIAFASPGKLDAVERILADERGRRTLIFTDDNATAYAAARRFLIPVITHQTKLKERTEVLRAFADGSLPILATSRVLNEGVDVPEAQVAIVVSGTGSVREHVQRLGRILRPRAGKRATLYELVTKDSAEQFTSERRRQHVAYR